VKQAQAPLTRSGKVDQTKPIRLERVRLKMKKSTKICPQCTLGRRGKYPRLPSKKTCRHHASWGREFLASQRMSHKKTANITSSSKLIGKKFRTTPTYTAKRWI
jgi:hypothetical protein